MRITRSSDWRSALTFDVPLIAAEVLPGEPARCALCPVGAEPRERTELWAVKHRHPHDPSGSVRLYCAEHVPAAPTPPSTVTEPSRSRASRAAKASRAPKTPRTPKAPARTEKRAAVCPDCFIEVPATGVCGMCGQRVA